MKEIIKEFFKPDRGKALIFITFMFIAYVGSIQRWAFSNGKDFGVPKPPLYDFFAPISFCWIIWVLLLWPLEPLSKILIAVGGYQTDFIMRGPEWLFWVIQVVYFYLLSCMMIFIWRKLHKN